jgi:glucokinase
VRHVLAGDIGGTKTRLRIAQCVGTDCRTRREQLFDSASYEGFTQLLEKFLAREAEPSIAAACFGVAGPVRETAGGQHVRLTNLPWEIDGGELARAFGIPRVRLINDFQAIGYGIEALSEPDFVVLQQGEPEPHGPRAVIGAGTGLGQAIMVWQQDRYEVIPTEGGHADFGPTDELQLELARWLMKNFGHASYELALSGPGIVRLYTFLRERGTAPESPAVAQAMTSGDPAAAITQAALERNDPLANETLDLFVRIYGAQAGNLALTVMATGGVYIAGGIAPQIADKLKDGAFLKAFNNKGRMSVLTRAMPVQVAMNPEVGLLGAALVASQL